MPPDGSGLTSQGGLLLSLLTESFAVRALVGSLAAGALAATAVRFDLLRSRRARRLVVVAPFLAAAGAAVASVAAVDDAYLPQLWVATSATTAAAGSLLELFGEPFGLDRDRGVDLLVLGYALVVATLLARRALGVLAVRRLVARGRPASDPRLVARISRLSAGFAIARPRLLLLEACPGGAFTVGGRRATVAVDPALLERLDDAELDGLLAHELAHVARRDTTLGSAVGVIRDFAFFLPPVHLATRWLRREQEESADELASTVTRRPVALASSILKVWDCARERAGDGGPREGLGITCAAVPPRARLAVAGGGTVAPAPSPAVQAITARVERLIGDAPAVTTWRRGVEVVVAATVLATATTAVIVVPGYIATELNTTALSVGYLSTPPPRTVEAPAFATFRALAPEAAASELRPTGEATAATASVGTADPRGCPCVESQAQLRAGVPAGPPSPAAGLQWRSAEHQPWQVSDRGGAVQARPLWTLSDSGPQVGVYLVGTDAP